MVKKTSLFLIFIVALFGCSRTVEVSQIPGVYTYGSKARLELKSDGRYRSSYQATDGQTMTQEDDWSFEIIEGVPTVILVRYRSELPMVRNSGQGLFLTQARWSGSKLLLWIDEQEKVFFERQTK